MKVSHVLRQKSGAGVDTVESTALLRTAAERFIGNKVRCLVVTREKQVVGVLTLRDVLRVLHATGTLDAPVSQAMSTDVVSATPETPLDDVQNLFAAHKINHVPVLQDGELVGVVTLADVLRVHLHDEAQLSAELRRYISGPSAL